MSDTENPCRPATERDLLYFSRPQLWETWPFLPVVRRRPGCDVECGILYDCWSIGGRAGLKATVFLCNLFLLPSTEEQFLALPKESFDTPEEIAGAGWRVD